MTTLTQIDVLTTMKAALERITRKSWPVEHRMLREFVAKEGKPGEDRVRLVDCSEYQKRSPLYRPEWAVDEMNSCDCHKCIAIRALDDVRDAQRGGSR